VDVVERDLIPRVPFEPRASCRLPSLPLCASPSPNRRRPHPASADARQPPKVPADWLEMSETAEPDPTHKRRPRTRAEKEAPKPVPLDDWTLVRLAKRPRGLGADGDAAHEHPGRGGAVFGGASDHGLPGHGGREGRGADQHNWLVDDAGGHAAILRLRQLPCFVWNVKRHRYETAHIEKNLRGYYPVEAHPVKMMAGKREAELPGVLVDRGDEDGVRWRKLYGFPYLPRGAAEEGAVAPAPRPATRSEARRCAAQAAPSVQPGLLARVAGWCGSCSAK